MKRPLLISFVAATLIQGSLSAETMNERIQAMELEMKKMQNEIGRAHV